MLCTDIFFRKCDNYEGEVVFYRMFHFIAYTGTSANHTLILHPKGQPV